MVEIIRSNFPLTPQEIIEDLRLRRPIYYQTARFGHFGRTGAEITWEQTDRATMLKKLNTA